MSEYNIAVIGSGPGGFAAAVRAAQLGASVAIIEKALIGGVCLNCGCMPTKFLWQALKTKQTINKSYEYGFKANLEPFSFADIIAKKDKTIPNIRKGMEMILKSYGIDVLMNEAASFKDKNTLLVGANEITADKIIIASGTKPSQIKDFAFNGKTIISSTHVLNLKELPANILIVGGGVIGVEMAAILAGFGSKVTIAEYEKCLLPSEDKDISAEITKSLQRQGVEVLTSCSNSLDSVGNYEKVLIVTGRKPVNELKLENAGIQTNQKGYIVTDEYGKTNIENIYAVGDIAGKNLLAYTAQHEGEVAAEQAMGQSGKWKVESGINDNIPGLPCNACNDGERQVVPLVTFSMPPSASVKVSNYGEYKNVLFGKFPFTASGRAFIENERSGFVKCAVDADTREPLAFWIIGAHADEIINTAAQIIKNAKPLSRENFFHPSLTESLYNAYEDAFGRCTENAKVKSGK